MPHSIGKRVLLSRLSGTQTTSAEMHGSAAAVYQYLNASDVRLPGSVGFTMRVGNVLSEDNALSANITLCHWLTPPFTHHIERHRKQHLPFHTVTLYHTKIENAICTAKIFRVF